MIRRSWLFALFLLLSKENNFSFGEVHFRKGAPHVKLHDNSHLSGKLEYSREGRPFNSFVGVPFGTIPERFHEAIPAPSWEGTFEAVNPGNMCIQAYASYDKVLTIGEEDCLNLNVYVPMNNTGVEGGYPVMVWIHGGGFSSGGGFGSGPKYLLDEDVILITVNYRVGVFGFLSTGDSVVPGNNGLKDIVLALKWVQRNIGHFGGNPEKVTIFGGSAGAAAVHYLTLSPITKGLFKQAISQSGSALAPWAINPNPMEAAMKLATYLNCPSSSSGDPSKRTSREIADCLKERNADEVNEAQFKCTATERWPPSTYPVDFLPVREPASSPTPFITESPWEIILKNPLPHKGIPYMTGMAEHEGASIYAGLILQDQDLLNELDSNWDDIILKATTLDRFVHPDEHKIVAEKIRKFYFGDKSVSLETRLNLTNLYSDVWFVYPARRTAFETVQKQETVYLFQFAYQGPVSLMRLFGYPMADEEAELVGHGTDFIMQFHLENMLPGAGDLIKEDSEHEVFSKNFVKQLVSFARDGKPSHTWGTPNVSWKPIAENELNIKSSPVGISSRVTRTIWTKTKGQ